MRKITSTLISLSSLLAVVGLQPSTAAASVAGGVQAESLSLPTSLGRSYDDGLASGGRALLIWSGGAATGSVTTGAASSITVRAKGDQCAGAPLMTVKLNGSTVLTTAVPSTSWTGHTAPVNLPAGTHGVSVAFTNDHLSSTCDRNLRVDSISLGSAAVSATAPAITAHSLPVTVVSGQAATLTVSATGATSYQWQKDAAGVWGNVTGATGATFTTAPLTASGTYRVAVRNAVGTVYSYPILVSVVAPSVAAPVITGQSGAVSVVAGQAATLSVSATGAASYQWQNDGYGVWGDMGGRTAATLDTGPMTATRSFRVAVTNAGGTVYSYPIPVTVTAPVVTAPVVTAPVVTAPVASDPLEGRALYVNPDNPARRQADAWRWSRPADARVMDRLAGTPTAKWFGGWATDIAAVVNNHVTAAQAANALPVLVAYNIPQRDCGQWSAGGSSSADAYRTWINGFARGIGDRPAVVILEPDALAHLSCLSAADQQTRIALLSDAVTALEARPNVAVYIDAGNPAWIPADQMAPRLAAAGIARAEGFALNVSSHHATDIAARYIRDLSARTGGKHAVLDTSRNGLGSNGEWCNPSGRAVGATPGSNTIDPTIDAYLWVKTPGESDGQCNGGPSAGAWWADYALGLAARAGW